MIDNSAILTEVFNLAAGIFVMVLAIYAGRKFRFVIFKSGWDVVAASGAIAAAASIFRIYYTYAHLYEEPLLFMTFIAWGRVFLGISNLVLMIGIYVLALTGIKLWGKRGED